MKHSIVNSEVRNLIQWIKLTAGILDKAAHTGPWHVQIDITDECNNDCLACWCNSPLLGQDRLNQYAKRESLPYNVTIKLINELNELGVRFIYLSGGGEPFMHPDCLKIMSHIKSLNIQLAMSTNFTLINRPSAESMVELGIDEVNISLWSANPETYARLHPNKNQDTFLQLVGAIDFMVRLKRRRLQSIPKLVMYNVISSLNYHEFIDMIIFAFKHRLDAITFVPAEIIPGKTDILKLTHPQRQSLLHQAKGIPKLIKIFQKKYRHKVHLDRFESFINRIEQPEQDGYDKNAIGNLPACYAGWYFSRVLANGDVHPCLKASRFPVGNIYKDKFKEIWYGAKQKRFRSNTLPYYPGNPFLGVIGNGRSHHGNGCQDGCDNLKENIELRRQLRKWRYLLKGYLKASKWFH